MRLNVLTWNVKDLPALYRSTATRHGKARAVGEVIQPGYRDGAPAIYDVVFLQESFDVRTRIKLGEEMRAYNVPANIRGRRKFFGIVPFDTTGGLVTLSRYPIADGVCAFYPFKVSGDSWDERACAKGYTKTMLITSHGEVLAVNTHLASWRRNVEARRHQLAQLLTDIERENKPVILGGDFNMFKIEDTGEPSDEARALQDAGFVDSLVGDEGYFPTFCVENPLVGEKDMDDLAKNGIPTSRRLDYIWVHENGTKLRPVRSDLAVAVDPVTDHYGLSTEFEIQDARRTG